MRPLLLSLLSATLCLSLGACGGEQPDDGAKPVAKKKKKTEKKAPPKKKAKPAPTFEMAPIDVTYEDFAAQMQAPKGATFKEEFGTLNVKLADGKQFWVQLSVESPDLEALKASAQKNTVQKLVKVHTDAADTLVYETKAFGRTSFWLDAAVRVGARTVHCYSGRGGSSYEQGEIEVMEKACKSLELKR